MRDTSDIRIGVVVDVAVMRRLGDMARERGVSVPEVISSILADAAQASDAPRLEGPAFVEDNTPTDVVTHAGHKWRRVKDPTTEE